MGCSFDPEYMRTDFMPQVSPARPWRTVVPHVYQTDYVTVTIPAHFYSDLASVPLWLTPFFPPKGAHQRGALFHDWLYYSHQMSRHRADRLFYEIMIGDGVPHWRAHAMYMAVHVFGEDHFHARPEGAQRKPLVHDLKTLRLKHLKTVPLRRPQPLAA